MSDEPIIDLRKLAEEAAATIYHPRAKRCWVWSHEWTMWQLKPYSTLIYNRRCVRCGRPQSKMFF